MKYHIHVFQHLRVTTALTCAFLTGCTTTQIHRPADPSLVVTTVQVGDTVKCTLHDKSVAEFKVVAADASTLRGENQSVATANIAQIEITRRSTRRTTALVTVLVLGTVVIAIIAHSPGAFLGGTVVGL